MVTAYHSSAMNNTCINPAIPESDRADEEITHESTYAMLVRSEEKERTVLETVVYFLVVLSTIAAIWQFAHQPFALPLETVSTVSTAVCGANTNC
jgi:hypothetical protein